MSEPIVLEVVGLPAPKGSKSIARGKGGQVWLKEGSSKEQRARLDQWNNAVAGAARDYLAAHPQQPLSGPLSVVMSFRFPPVASAPDRYFHIVEPDADKLARATGDALKHGGLIADDKLFVQVSIDKRYAGVDENIGCTIRLRSLVEIERTESEKRKARRKGLLL